MNVQRLVTGFRVQAGPAPDRRFLPNPEPRTLNPKDPI